MMNYFKVMLIQFIVLLPNHLHYEFSKKALENGKNVIIENQLQRIVKN